MRDTNIKGSHECGTWYRMDPKYTVEFLKNHAVVTGTDDQACTCDGCNGNKALSYCKHDKDDGSDYMDIDTAKANGLIEKMRLAINDDMLDPDKCRKNKFCREHTCLEVQTCFCLCLGCTLWRLIVAREYLEVVMCASRLWMAANSRLCMTNKSQHLLPFSSMFRFDTAG